MTDSPTPPPPKLLGKLSTKLKMAGACALVLAVGAATAPRVAPSALQTPAERPAPLLEEQVQTRIVSQPFLGVSDMAGRVGAESVGIPPDPRPPVDGAADYAFHPDAAGSGGYGVFVSPTDILTSARAVDMRTQVTVTAADGTAVDATLVAFEPDTELVLLRTSTPSSPLVSRTSVTPAVGALAVAAARVAGRDTIVPLYVTQVDGREYRVSDTGGLEPGMPIYTLDGGLFALVVDRSGRAHAVWDAADRLTAQADSSRRFVSLGLSYQALTDGLIPTFGDRGVLVTDVVTGGPAEAAGLVPGDVLLALGDTAVAFDTMAATVSQLPTSTVTVRVRRGRREQAVGVTPAPAHIVSALARRSAGESMTAPLAASVLPAEVRERAALSPLARLLRINQRVSPSRADVTRELARDPRAVLLVRDGRRTYFTALGPS